VSTKLQTQLRQIRELKSKGSNYEVEALFKVIELEKMSVLWRTGGNTTFDDVLTSEKGICTPSRFKAFKKANTHFSSLTIHKLGVPCVCLLAVQNEGTRNKLLSYALKYREKNGGEPTYQYICRFLKKAPTGPSRGQLIKYIDTLRKTIKDLGGRVPVMPF
jgi:hypothetical protein